MVEDDVLKWCAAVSGEEIPNGAYEDVLKNGVILCKVMNKLLPGSIPKINTSGGKFENFKTEVLIQNILIEKIFIFKFR